MLGYDLTTVRNFNYTFGINLAFGRGRIKKSHLDNMLEAIELSPDVDKPVVTDY